MQTSIHPTLERAISVLRDHARRPHPAARLPIAQPQPRSGQPAANQEIERNPRQRVAQAFRDMANGVATPIADEQTRAFYRSGGQDWAKNLD